MGDFMNVTCLGNRRHKHNKNNNHKQVLPPLHNLTTSNTKINKHNMQHLKNQSINMYACMIYYEHTQTTYYQFYSLCLFNA